MSQKIREFTISYIAGDEFYQYIEHIKNKYPEEFLVGYRATKINGDIKIKATFITREGIQ